MLRKLILTATLSLATLTAAVPAQAQGFPIGLLFGLLIGSDNGAPPLQKEAQEQLARIPLRCLALVESDEAAYRTCRTPSMMAEIGNQLRSIQAPDGASPCANVLADDKDLFHREREGFYKNYKNYYRPLCDTSQHITWEIAALKALAEQVKAAQAAAKPAN